MSVDGAPDTVFCPRCTRHPAACECGGGHLETRPTNPRIAVPHPLEPAELNFGISGTPSGGAASWEPPAPIEAPPLPSLPVERLGRLSRFVTAAAQSLQTSPDLVAFAALAAISTATGGRRVVEVKAGWIESIALYLVALADSSERKTPALAVAAKPLRDVEVDLAEQRGPEVAQIAQEIRVAQAQMQRAEQRAADPKKHDEAMAEADAARLRLLELGGEPPALPRLLVGDTTLEALARIMYEQGGRIGCLASEGGLFKVAAGLYSGAGQANTDLLLEAYTGSPYSVDRTGRPTLRMRSTFLTLGLIVQPGIVDGLERRNPEFRHSGLLGRFLYCLPAIVDSDRFDTPAIPADIQEDYERRIRTLVTQVWDSSETVTMRLSDGARRRFGSYYDEFGPRRKPGGDLHSIADWAGKLRGQLIRIAACLALYENPHAVEITEDRISDVLALADYFIAHACRAFDLMASSRTERLRPLRDVLAWLRARRDPSAPFSARDVWQALKGRAWAVDMHTMKETLAELEEYGWIAEAPTTQTPGRRGRKPSPRYEVHPWIAEGRRE